MKLTLSVIKADVGSIGGHICPSKALIETVKGYVRDKGKGLLIDSYVNTIGDDVHILMTHTHGDLNSKVHELAWNAFFAATETAKSQGLYGAGQDLLKNAFSGNVRGLGPACAEITCTERPNESFVMFAADKTEPGAYNLPLYLSFADPMHCAGFMLSPPMFKGFTFRIMDCDHVDGDRTIDLNAPEDLYGIATLLRDNSRYVIEGIYSRYNGEKAAAVSTSRLRLIAGKYTGKDDPVCLVRVQGNFPSVGEITEPYAIAHFVAGTMRGSHNSVMMPVKTGSNMTYFDGPTQVCAQAFSVHDGRLTEAVDMFDHPVWDVVRNRASEKFIELRRQGFSGPAMLGIHELEYGGVVEKLKELDERFKISKEDEGTRKSKAQKVKAEAGEDAD